MADENFCMAIKGYPVKETQKMYWLFNKSFTSLYPIGPPMTSDDGTNDWHTGITNYRLKQPSGRLSETFRLLVLFRQYWAHVVESKNCDRISLLGGGVKQGRWGNCTVTDTVWCCTKYRLPEKLYLFGSRGVGVNYVLHPY